MSEQSDRMHGLIERTVARHVRADPRLEALVPLASAPLPWFAVRSAAMVEEDGEDAPAPAEPGTATVYVFDEIGGSMGVSASKLVREIDAITEPTIQVRINSPGGSVRDAIAIYNALNHHPARIETYVDAMAASAATIIAFAGDEVTVMPGGQMMFHDASMEGGGNSADWAHGSTFLDRQSQNVAGIYALRTPGLSADDWRSMMLEETWMYGHEAVEMGAADRVDTGSAPVAPEPVLAERMARAHDLTRFAYRGRRNPPRRAAAGDRPRSLATARAVDRTPPDVSGRDIPEQPVDLKAAAEARAEATERRAHALAQEGRSVPVLRTSDQFRSQLRVVRAEMPMEVGAARLQGFSSKLQRAANVNRGGKELAHVAGYASMYGQKHSYEMWDSFGPYLEWVKERAGSRSLSKGPDVAFLMNHMGVTMARSKAGTLDLADDDDGLADDAYVNPDRQDVQILLTAIDDGNVNEQSFAFMIDQGEWSEDFTSFCIVQYDIDRGDVSAVNFGANPFTSIAARGQQIMADLDRLPSGLAAAAYARLARRTDVAAGRAPRPAPAEPAPTPAEVPAPVATGRRITHIEALLGDD